MMRNKLPAKLSLRAEVVWPAHVEYDNSGALFQVFQFSSGKSRFRRGMMISYNTKSQVRTALQEWRRNGERIGAVFTMGALHEGHLSLLDTAKENSDRALATVFVNPLQFGPNEDFDTYPRTLEADAEKLAARGCDLLFAPTRSELFAPDFSTKVSVSGVGEGHCADMRPQFFDGVATIVTKLLLLLSPDVAVFGEKDYQQLQVITRLVRDLDIDVEIIGSPIIRETDGLAMSSRNLYLSRDERAVAPALYETLTQLVNKLKDASADWSSVRDRAVKRLTDAGFSKVDYINLVDATTLALLDKADRPGRLLAAAWIGKTRLIDNIPIAAAR